ncbi:MAG: HlyD family type I secretion periplasmic adaptor subunit [Desulfuromonadaceae bacterium]|nr:HlyD family type I secretion periplasmic adaptor subunit [Desulfuromonadaceae bacterium]
MIARFIDWILRTVLPVRTRENYNWELEADWAQIDQQPLRARALLYWVGVMIVILVVWSAYAQIDEVTRGEGRVIPSRQVQIIQAVDGGIVSDIRVREGQVVNEGQMLLQIDPTRFVSSFRENQAQYHALLVRAERLKALAEKRAFLPPAEVVKENPEIIEHEKDLYETTLREVEAQLAIARQQLEQRGKEYNEAEANRDQLNDRYVLLERELEVTKPLVSKGAVSEVELLRLEREVAQLRGQRNQVAAQLERIQSGMEEGQRKIQEVELSFYNKIRRELSETMATLGGLAEEKTALADRVKHAVVRSPVRGTVKRLYVNTVGGVVQQGKEVVEIVPLDDTLVLEVKVNPKDIAFLRPDLPAKVRFTAYDFSIYGSLEAVVETIGADTVVDERGNAFYIVRVRTLKASLGENLPIIPGMVAQVDILTGKKTLLTYLLKPILRAKTNALGER